MDYQRTIELDVPYEEAVERTRKALSEQGFGVLTEIDLKATLKAKKDVDIEPYLILGACNPGLAHRALEVDRGVGVLLPCNVVVSGRDDGGSTVRVLEPQLFPLMSGLPALQDMADEASDLLDAALRRIGGH